jgi:hypothetical protein
MFSHGLRHQKLVSMAPRQTDHLEIFSRLRFHIAFQLVDFHLAHVAVRLGEMTGVLETDECDRTVRPSTYVGKLDGPMMNVLLVQFGIHVEDF